MRAWRCSFTQRYIDDDELVEINLAQSLFDSHTEPSAPSYTSSDAGQRRVHTFGTQRIISSGGRWLAPVAVATMPRATKSLVGGTTEP